MEIAAAICAFGALAVIVNIEAWRRRTVAHLRAQHRREATRERAWQAIAGLDVGE